MEMNAYRNHQLNSEYLGWESSYRPTHTQSLPHPTRPTCISNYMEYHDPTISNWNYPNPTVSNWEYNDSSMFPLNIHISPETTPIPAQSRKHHWYSNNNVESETLYSLRHRLKRQNKTTLQNESLKMPPSRKITRHFHPYPLQELQEARSTLIDELYVTHGGIVLLKVRKAAGIYEDLSSERNNIYRVTYASQSTFLLTVPLPCPSKDDIKMKIK